MYLMRQFNHVIQVILTCALASHVSGCASLATTFENDPEVDSKIYIGTRFDSYALASMFTSETDSGGKGMMVLAFPVFLIDLPLSVIMDTVLLPYTINYKAPRHQALTLGREVEIEGKLDKYGVDDMLVLSSSVYVLDRPDERTKNKDRTKVIQLLLSENQITAFRQFSNKLKYGQTIKINGILNPKKTVYFVVNVTAFAVSP